MMLHFNYHIGELFYGIEITIKSADGTVPLGTHIIRNIFYHLPIVWIIILILTDAKVIRAGLFIISLVYLISHGLHLAKDLINPHLSQTPLLCLSLIISVLVSIEHYKYWKKFNRN